MNEYHNFEGPLISNNRLKSAEQTIVEFSGIRSGRSKVVSRRADDRPGTISSYLDGWADDWYNNLYADNKRANI